MRPRVRDEAAGGAAAMAALRHEIINLRDFGDMPTVDGGRVCAGQLYRSGHLGQLSARGCALLDAMGFSLVVDLRFAQEREESGSRWPKDGAVTLLRVEGGAEGEGPHVALLRSGTLDPARIDAFYTEFYRAIPFDPFFQPLFGEIIRRLAETNGRALIHCSVGKDRTGILVALIQHLLGVPRDAMLADYMETRAAPGLNQMIPEIVARLEDRLNQPVSEAIARKMLGVEEDYLIAALDAIAAACGSVEAYLEQSGVTARTRERLRARLIC